MSLKAKYLLDHCISLEGSVTKNKEFLQSRDVLGEEAKDEEILDYVIKNNLVLITNDTRFSLRTALTNHPVKFYDREANKTYQITAKETKDAMKFSDSATFYLLENDEIVLP